ncbi:MAG: tetratricopeptide repeat protein, partial [Planctomycetota bacterium]|nr:tetratricopeptide repeat protein [Planctomycetota bacterium]
AHRALTIGKHDVARTEFASGRNLLTGLLGRNPAAINVKYELARNHYIEGMVQRWTQIRGTGSSSRNTRRGRPFSRPSSGGRIESRPGTSARPPQFSGNRNGSRPSGPSGRSNDPRNRGSDPSRRQNPFEAAIKLLVELTEEQPKVAEYRRLLAICYRDQSWFRSDNIDKAIEILKELSEQYPQIADYQFELLQTYGRVRSRERSPSAEEIKRVNDSFQHALTIGKQLTAEHPHIPSYVAALSRLRHTMGRTAIGASFSNPERRDELLAEAEKHYLAATTQSDDLVTRFPDVGGYASQSAFLNFECARLLVSRNKNEQAQKCIERTIELLKQTSSSDRTTPSNNWLLVGAYDTLAGILKSIHGEDSSEYREVKELANELRFRGRESSERSETSSGDVTQSSDEKTQSIE